MKINKFNKSGQNEIAGFVLIVLVVTIMGVVFLSISLGSRSVERETSLEVSNLLESGMYHTTDCAINYIPQYRNVQDLIKECYKDRSGNFRECLGGGDVCESLKTNMKSLIDRGLLVGESSPNKAYRVDIYFSDDNAQNEEILSFEEGQFSNCSSIVGGSHPIPVSSFGFGKIETELLVCKG